MVIISNAMHQIHLFYDIILSFLVTYLSSIQAMLYRSPKQVEYSGGGGGYSPGQYVPQLLSTAFEAVVA